MRMNKLCYQLHNSLWLLWHFTGTCISHTCTCIYVISNFNTKSCTVPGCTQEKLYSLSVIITQYMSDAYWWGNNLRHTAEVWIKFSVKSCSCANCWKGLKHPPFSAGDDDSVCVVGDDTDLSLSRDKSPSNWSFPWLRDSTGSAFSFFFVFFSTLGGS